MSKQKKRLTDAERERDLATINKYIPNHTPPVEAMARLVADHLRAREDVKRLVRKMTEWGACLLVKVKIVDGESFAELMSIVDEMKTLLSEVTTP